MKGLDHRERARRRKAKGARFRRLMAEGWKVKEIAASEGCSTQYVYRLAKHEGGK